MILDGVAPPAMMHLRSTSGARATTALDDVVAACSASRGVPQSASDPAATLAADRKDAGPNGADVDRCAIRAPA